MLLLLVVFCFVFNAIIEKLLINVNPGSDNLLINANPGSDKQLQLNCQIIRRYKCSGYLHFPNDIQLSKTKTLKNENTENPSQEATELLISFFSF